MRYLLADEENARRAARILTEMNCILFYKDDNPFCLSNGIISPVFIDCRKLVYNPFVRGIVADMMVEQICRNIGYSSIDVVASSEAAGIPFATLIAERMQLPMVYARQESLTDREVGDDIEGRRVLVVGDLTTDGMSKARICRQLEQSGAQTVSDCSVVFFYDLPSMVDGSGVEEYQVTLHYLTSWRYLLEHIMHSVALSRRQVSQIDAFLSDPLGWAESVNRDRLFPHFVK